jgi:isochorismate synthase
VDDTQNIGALVYLPEEKSLSTYSKDNLHQFTKIKDYWMKEEGLVFFPFNRNRTAYFFSKNTPNDAELTFEFMKNESITKEEYTTSVFMAQQEMKAGNFSKVVLARNEILTGDFNALDAFENGVKKYPESFGYFVDLGEQQWVGASPELLLHFEEGMVYTVALAGTKELNESFTAKEQEEQAMVEAFIEEKLELAGIPNYQKSEKQEAKFGKIKHLKTAYTAPATDKQALELLQILQPTSAVCGLPREESFGFIQEFETLNRSFYSGITGVLKKDAATFFVNLRCMRFFEKSVELFAGAGITKESEPEQEWIETENKIAAIKSLL